MDIMSLMIVILRYTFFVLDVYCSIILYSIFVCVFFMVSSPCLIYVLSPKTLRTAGPSPQSVVHALVCKPDEERGSKVGIPARIWWFYPQRCGFDQHKHEGLTVNQQL